MGYLEIIVLQVTCITINIFIHVRCVCVTDILPCILPTPSLPIEILELWDNKLVGSIPTELGNLDSFTYLDVTRNSLTGIIPTELGNLNSLVYLYIEENILEGTMPLQLWNIPDVCES